MTRAARNRDALPLALGLIALAAWVLIVLGAVGVVAPDMCAAMSPWHGQAGASLGLALAINPPAMLAGAWALMLAATMSPLLFVPLAHVRERSLASRRLRSMLLFASAFAAVWMAAGAVLAPLTLFMRLLTPGPAPAIALAAAALAWQVSPAKQACLNRRHRLPPLAALGAAADRDALGFGLTHGIWCVGSCWALMALPLMVGGGHLTIMAATALWLFGEHLERPEPLCWKWRWPVRAVRIIATQARMRLLPAQ